MELAGATWPDIAATGRAYLLAVPIGSLEQHGPHLPLNTDTRIAEELATRLSLLRTDVVVAPALAYGASGEHAAFPGTLLVRHDVLTELVSELVRSARGAFAGVILVSAHGGNADALAQAAERAEREGDDVVLWAATVRGGDAHAGRTETSLMLAIDPGAVRLDRAEPGCTEPLESIMPRLRAEGVGPVSSNGVLGDPGGASDDEGRQLLRDLSADLLGAVEARWPGPGSAP
jgi:mycofactocin system creatininase family protein